MNHLKGIILVSVFFTIISCSKQEEASSIIVNKTDYGKKWPYPNHEQAVVQCENRTFGGIQRPVVTIYLGKTLYGMNGTAIGVAGFPDAKTQLGKHPEWGSLEMGASHEILELGLTICSGVKNT